MQVINWLALIPGEMELQNLQKMLSAVTAARKLRQFLVQSILDQYPWEQRNDLVDVYHPARQCQKGEWLAWIMKDAQGLRPPTWVLGHILQVEETQNPVQGKFQVITVDIHEKSYRFASGIAAAPDEGVDFSQLAPEDLEALAVRIADFYAQPLQSTLERLTRRGLLPGRFVGETFVRNDLPVISADELAKHFDRLTLDKPWISASELLSVVRIRDELQTLPDDILLPLLRSALENRSFHNLGCDRWTTPALYEQINRDVPRGLPVPRVRSQLDIWTEQDLQDLVDVDLKSLAEEVQHALNDDDGEVFTALDQVPWQAPAHPIRLPTLSYLHIIQAYFPIGKITSAFSPDVQLVIVKVIEGDYQPFLVDRHLGVLKALDMEKLRVTCLDAGIPAGTHLWLEYQGGDRYRIAPRPLPEPHMVPCKLAHIEDGKLHIEHTEIPMLYEGNPSVFKADMRFSDIEALFAEARRCQLSVLDAMIQSVQGLCAADPHGQAHRLDIFNAWASPNKMDSKLRQVVKPSFELFRGNIPQR